MAILWRYDLRSSTSLSADATFRSRPDTPSCTRSTKPGREPESMKSRLAETSAKRRSWLVLSAIVIALCPSASALQNANRIEGTVTDQTGAPVAAAEVTVAGAASPIKQLTNSVGRFVVDSAPTDGTITVRASGFNAFQRKWTSSEKDLSPLEVVLTPTLSAQITVTAERAETRVSDTAASVAVLSREDIATTAALTTDDALRQIPGFSLFRRSGSRTANPTSQGV